MIAQVAPSTPITTTLTSARKGSAQNTAPKQTAPVRLAANQNLVIGRYALAPWNSIAEKLPETSAPGAPNATPPRNAVSATNQAWVKTQAIRSLRRLPKIPTSQVNRIKKSPSRNHP